MAPTKPLVTQQIQNCFNIMDVPQADVAELTGTTMAKAKRAEVWRTKRLVFCTPHTLNNDLKEMPALAHRIVCVVVDEAHRASAKNYPHSQVIRRIRARTPFFRVVALTATPGAK